MTVEWIDFYPNLCDFFSIEYVCCAQYMLDVNTCACILTQVYGFYF